MREAVPFPIAVMVCVLLGAFSIAYLDDPTAQVLATIFGGLIFISCWLWVQAYREAKVGK